MGVNLLPRLWSPLSVLVGLFGLEEACLTKNGDEALSPAWCRLGIEVKGETGCSTEVRGLDTRGTGGKWELKAHLIHQSVLAQIVRDGSC